MDNSPLRFVMEEQVIFSALYKESIKMTKRKNELKDLLKKVILEEAIEQRVASMEIDVTSLQDDQWINTSLNDDLARQKNEYTKIHKEKVDLVKSVDGSL